MALASSRYACQTVPRRQTHLADGPCVAGSAASADGLNLAAIACAFASTGSAVTGAASTAGFVGEVGGISTAAVTDASAVAGARRASAVDVSTSGRTVASFAATSDGSGTQTIKSGINEAINPSASLSLPRHCARLAAEVSADLRAGLAAGHATPYRFTLRAAAA